MPKVAGEPLHAYGEPRWRREHPIDGDEVVAALLALHDAIAALHRARRRDRRLQRSQRPRRRAGAST